MGRRDPRVDVYIEEVGAVCAADSEAPPGGRARGLPGGDRGPQVADAAPSCTTASCAAWARSRSTASSASGNASLVLGGASREPDEPVWPPDHAGRSAVEEGPDGVREEGRAPERGRREDAAGQRRQRRRRSWYRRTSPQRSPAAPPRGGRSSNSRRATSANTWSGSRARSARRHANAGSPRRSTRSPRASLRTGRYMK